MCRYGWAAEGAADPVPSALAGERNPWHSRTLGWALPPAPPWSVLACVSTFTVPAVPHSTKCLLSTASPWTLYETEAETRLEYNTGHVSEPGSVLRLIGRSPRSPSDTREEGPPVRGRITQRLRLHCNRRTRMAVKFRVHFSLPWCRCACEAAGGKAPAPNQKPLGTDEGPQDPPSKGGRNNQGHSELFSQSPDSRKRSHCISARAQLLLLRAHGWDGPG